MKEADSQTLESKIRLIRLERERLGDDVAKVVQEHAAKKMLRNGATIRRVFDLAFEYAKRSADDMITAHLAVGSPDDKRVASEIRSDVETFLRNFLKDQGARGYATDKDHWDKCIAEMWPPAESFFGTLEDRVRSARHDQRSRETRVDKFLKWTKDHPVMSKVLIFAICVSAVFGFIRAIADGINAVKSLRPDPSSENSSR